MMGSVNGLSPNSVYDYTVEAMAGGAVVDSGSGQHTTAPAMMDAIQNVKPKDSKTMIVEFPLETGATEYIVRVQNNDGFFREDTVPASPAEIENLTPYTSYDFRIMAVNGDSRSQPSPPVTEKTVLPPPVLETSSPCNSSIIVSWEAIPHAVQYSVSLYRFDSNEVIKHNTSDTNLTVYDLQPGSLYMIKASAWDPEGRRGEASAYVNQTTRPPTPVGVSVSVTYDVGPAGLLVSWTLDENVHGVIDYNVTCDHGQMCSSTSDSCVLSPVSCGEVHSIQVIASNDAGPSYPSDPTMFITFPCPPENLAVEETAPENCTLSWDSVDHADSYRAYFKNGAGEEEVCNTTGNNCSFHCDCGYQYLMMVSAINEAGESPKGMTLNYTTVPCCPEAVSVSLVSTDTLEIMWEAARGADLYETRAADDLEDIRCNDTAPVCALSDLSCDRSYSVVVIPCNDVSGCNRNCGAHTRDTAPCTPTGVTLSQQSDSSVTVSWSATNRAATYTVSAVGNGDVYTCSDPGSSCDISGLPCGCTFEVSVIANSSAGQSLPSFSHSMETDPCCPDSLSVDQVTQAMTNVSWSHAKGAYSFITSLTSTRGHARCHTEDSHCLMGCITCGTNYTVAMEAYSQSGRMSNCTYQGFSSSICCPSGVRLYKLSNSALRVFWRSAGSIHNYQVDLIGANTNYTCQASAGQSSCDIDIVQCGDVYRVVVAPVTPEGTVVPFCAHRMYSVACSDSVIGSVIYRGKRSVE